MTRTEGEAGLPASDRALFAPDQLAALRLATAELSWLLSRGYREPSAVKLVGDRHQLTARQRQAVARCTCTDQALARRSERRLPLGELSGRAVSVDGFNCLITVETALAGGIILRGRDGCVRDLASVHGSYRRGARTSEAVALIGEALHEQAVSTVEWRLDRPVRRSGELRRQLLTLAGARGWRWSVVVEDNPDTSLVAASGVAATCDSWVLDRCATWTDLAGAVIDGKISDVWLVDLASGACVG